MRYPVAKNENDFKKNWYVALGFGEQQPYGFHEGGDINLKTGGDSDLGEPIHAISKFTREYFHFNSHPEAGFGVHYVYKIEGPWGTRWVHCAHNMIAPEIQNKTDGNEGELLSYLGKTGRPRSELPAHLHFSIFKVDPATLPNGIDTIAKTKQQLNDWWEDPIAFIEKYLNTAGGGDMANNDTIIKKSTQWDRTCAEYELGDPNHTLFEKVQDFIGGLRSRITDLDKKVAHERTEKENREEQVSRLKADLLEASKRENSLVGQLNDALKEPTKLKGVIDGQAKEIGGLRLALAEAEVKHDFKEVVSFLGIKLYVKAK